jgi:hypothetical protein
MEWVKHYQGKDADYVREGVEVLKRWRARDLADILMVTSYLKRCDAIKEAMAYLKRLDLRRINLRQRRCLIILIVRDTRYERAVERLGGKV